MSAALAEAQPAAPTEPAEDGPFLLHPEPPPTPSTLADFAAHVDARTLLTAVRDVAVAIPRRPAVPVFAHVHLQPVDGGLQLTGSHFETTVRRIIPAHSSSGRACLVPPAWLTRAALFAGAGSLRFAEVSHPQADTKDERTVLVASDGIIRRRHQLMDASEWPTQLPVDDPAEDVDPAFWSTMTWAELQHLLTVAPFAARPGDAPILTAVRLRRTGGVIDAAATDRYRMGHARVTGQQPGPLMEVLAPAAALQRVLARFGKGGAVRVSTTDEHLLLTTVTGTAAIALTGGQYPPTDRLWPTRETDVHAAVIVDRRALATLVERVQTGDRDPMRLTVSPDRIDLASGDGTYDSTEAGFRPTDTWLRPGGPLTDPNPARAGLSLGVNPIYFKAALAAFDHEHVELSFTGPSKPVWIHGLDARPLTPGDGERTPPWSSLLDTSSAHLLMPTRVAGGDR